MAPEQDAATPENQIVGYQTIRSVISDCADWTFLDDWFADDRETLTEIKNGLKRAETELLNKK